MILTMSTNITWKIHSKCWWFGGGVFFCQLKPYLCCQVVIEAKYTFKTSNNNIPWLIWYAMVYLCRLLWLQRLQWKINSTPITYFFLTIQFYEKQVYLMAIVKHFISDTITIYNRTITHTHTQDRERKRHTHTFLRSLYTSHWLKLIVYMRVYQ